jgi:type II secretory pathway component GspD/PulD (secretin)
MKTRLFALVALFALATSSAVAQEGDASKWVKGQGPNSIRINVDLDGVELADVMEQIGRQVGRNILVDPNVEEVVRVSLRDILWREAVDVIARMTRCEVEERPGGIMLLTQPPKVTIQFTDANVRTVLQLLAAYSGKNIIISPDVRGTVTLDLKEVHWLRALHAIVKTVGDFEVVEETEDLLRVVTRTSIEQQLETHVFKLNYIRPPAIYRAVPPSSAAGGDASASAVFVGQVANAAAANISETFTLFRSLRSVIEVSQIQGATLEYDEQTNAFIITATKPLIVQIRKIIEKVDLEPAQIYTQVKFVSTVDNNNQEYGIEFSEGSTENGLVWRDNVQGPFVQGGDLAISQTPSNAAPNPAQSVGRFGFLIGEGMDNFTQNFNIPAILDFSQFGMALNMIDRDVRSRVVQSPSLFMLDNQDAVIFVGDQVPYAEQVVTQDANGNQQVAIAEGSRSPVAIGFSLFVQPHVIPDSDRLQLTVIPRVNDLTGTTSPIPGFERFAAGQEQLDLPRTREQAIVTHILLEDTSTAVIGGLLTESDSEIVKRVPILSSIPIIGNLFTKKEKLKRLENLTIFVTPTLVRPGQRRTVDSIFMRATRRLEQTDYFYRTFEAPSEDEEDASYELEEDE